MKTLLLCLLCVLVGVLISVATRRPVEQCNHKNLSERLSEAEAKLKTADLIFKEQVEINANAIRAIENHNRSIDALNSIARW